MSTDFFTSQDAARKQTGRLVALFVLGVFGTILSMWLVAVAVLAIGGQKEGAPDWAGAFSNMKLLGGIAGSVLVVVGIASLVKLAQLSQGGERIAEMLGGHRIDPGTRDRRERELLNIVEEMSIASGVPVPPVYVMETPAINAFAAGPDPSRSVIGVTRGCMQLLSRDEMQGVVAHEYSHIFHGDTRINARTTAVIAGIMAVGTIGYICFRFIGPQLARSGGGNRKNNGAAVGLAIIVIGLAIWAIGSCGVLVGRLIQAAISRQREFLADAAAVQYTRNPNGIAGALAKIRGHSARIDSPAASELNHFFFCTSLNTLFATHPPIEERIKRIVAMGARGDFDAATVTARSQPARSAAAAGPVAGLAETVDHAGTLDAAGIAAARAFRDGLPDALQDAAHSADGARAICYLIARRNGTHENCDRLVLERDRAAYDPYRALAGPVEALAHDRQLALADIAAPALAGLGQARYRQFRETLTGAMRSDAKVDLREWALAKCLERHVERRFAPAARSGTARLADVAGEMRTVVALVAIAAHGDAGTRGYSRAYGVLGMQPPAFPPSDALTLDALDAAVRRLSALSFAERGRLLKACAAAATHDGEVTAEEHLIVRAVADALDVPVPALA